MLARADGDPATSWATECYSSQYMGAKRGRRAGGLVRHADAAGAGRRRDQRAVPAAFFASDAAVAPTDLDDWGPELGDEGVRLRPGNRHVGDPPRAGEAHVGAPQRNRPRTTPAPRPTRIAVASARSRWSAEPLRYAPLHRHDSTTPNWSLPRRAVTAARSTSCCAVTTTVSTRSVVASPARRAMPTTRARRR